MLKKFNFSFIKKIYQKIKTFYFKSFYTMRFGTIKSLRSEADDGFYLYKVFQATYNQNTFNNFKNDDFYRNILEHVTYEEGLKYLSFIKKDEDLFKKIDEFLINDEIGNPIRYFYSELNKKISPTTLRYIKVASDIKKIFKKNITSIVEIGCGYGGQYLILDKIKKIEKYTLIDLYDVNKLIEKYLEYYLLNSSYETKTINQISQNKVYDLVISNYAFSELPMDTQILYIKKIMMFCKNGYLTMNSGSENNTFKKNHLTVNEIKKFIPNLKIIPEEPVSSEGNYIIIWGEINF